MTAPPPGVGAHAADAKRAVADPGGIRELANDLRGAAAGAEALVRRYLERIDAAEPRVQAWRVVDGEGALAQARALDREAAAGRARGPLHGIPVGVKDVIDVAGLPTRCNARGYQDRPPACADAQVVAALRAAGALVLGKTHTTEFAFFDPSPARNPHHTAHTPGGSSSGSAAAVAAGMVPAALGTQTVASVNRPAAYCGVAAFKPSTGLLSTHGVTPLAPMFDTVGFFGRRVADAAALFEAVCPAHAAPAAAADGALTVVRLTDPVLDDAEAAVHASLDAAALRLREAGQRVAERASGESFAELRELQWLCTLYEMARVHRELLREPPGQVGEKLRAALEEGGRIAHARYYAARAALDGARARLFGALRDADAVLWPATPAAAPPGLAWTGDPRYISPWTALGGPVVTVPVAADAAGLPLGVLLTGAPGSDRRFAAVATRLASAMEI